jgi:hypothetical protein
VWRGLGDQNEEWVSTGVCSGFHSWRIHAIAAVCPSIRVKQRLQLARHAPHPFPTRVQAPPPARNRPTLCTCLARLVYRRELKLVSCVEDDEDVDEVVEARRPPAGAPFGVGSSVREEVRGSEAESVTEFGLINPARFTRHLAQNGNHDGAVVGGERTSQRWRRRRRCGWGCRCRCD